MVDLNVPRANPRTKICPMCKLVLPEMLLMYDKAYVTIDETTGMQYYGMTEAEAKAHDPKARGPWVRRDILESEQVPDTEPCDACVTKLADMNTLVTNDGAIMWRCLGCGSMGTLDEYHPLTMKTRMDEGEEYSKPHPDTGKWLPLGMEVPNCPSCTKEGETPVNTVDN